MQTLFKSTFSDLPEKDATSEKLGVFREVAGKITLWTYNVAMPKPCVFIGSSSEQLPLARAFAQCLRRDAIVTVWDEGVFNLGSSTLDDLLRALDEYDFAVFIFSADDLIRIRHTEKPTVRDNVVFELGLFMGRIGKHRSFWITPRGVSAPHIPTDLLGINTATIERSASSDPTEDIRARVEPPCTRVLDIIRRLGRRTDRLVDELENPRIFCGASPEYAKLGFTGDVDAICANFKGSITISHELDATHLRQLLLDGPWDIIHLVSYVDPVLGDVVLGDVRPNASTDSSAQMNRVPAAGFGKLVEMSNTRLVVLATCDSLALAARLARVTNVVAGFASIEVRTAVEWTSLFYALLARGKTLSVAFDVAQKATEAGMVLLTKRDFRMSVPSVAD